MTPEPAKLKKVLFLFDFDYTLFNAKALKEKWQSSIVSTFLRPKKEIKIIFNQTYGQARDLNGHYDIKMHSRLLARRLLDNQTSTISTYQKKISVLLTSAIKTCSEFLYEKKLAALIEDWQQELQKKNYQPAFQLLSLGQADFQSQKISVCSPYLGPIDVVGAGVTDKKKYCRKLQGFDLIVIINDRLQESRKMAQVLESKNAQIQKIIIKRSGNPYKKELKNQVLEENEHTCVNLQEVIQLSREFLC